MELAALPSQLLDVNLRIALRRLADEALEKGDGPIGAILEVAIRTLDQRIATFISERDSGGTAPPISTALVSRNVRVAGRRTTIKLEDEFWCSLERIAAQAQSTVDDVIAAAEALYDGGNLTSAIRVFALRCAEGMGQSSDERKMTMR